MGRRSRRPAAPSAVIVVDTTVWIDFLEARGTAFDRHLTELVETDAPIALVDIVYCEVLQGIRDDDAYQRTRVSLRAHPILQPGGLETFETAANLYRAARRRGLTVRRSVDCLIAAICLESGAEIYHNDRDFDALASVSDLAIYHPAGASANSQPFLTLRRSDRIRDRKCSIRSSVDSFRPFRIPRVRCGSRRPRLAFPRQPSTSAACKRR